MTRGDDAVTDRDDRVCRDWGGTCPNGTLATPPEARVQDNQCAACAAGFRLERATHRCMRCPQGTFTGSTRATNDAGTGTTFHTSDACTPRTQQCAAGEYLEPAATPGDDNTCRGCPTGFYRGARAHAEPACAAKANASSCAEGAYLAVVGGAVNDNVCVDAASRCGAGEYLRIGVANATEGGDKHVCVACQPGRFRSAPQGNTGGGAAPATSSAAASASASAPRAQVGYRHTFVSCMAQPALHCGWLDEDPRAGALTTGQKFDHTRVKRWLPWRRRISRAY